ncbi:MAG TPA: dihydrolipoamide acetyltransferase family protein [Steroidobacteraceae bacterium]|nr:dihydrolipoamide acetyltransferase family protein [Steroidobacteraceae bacterium]
MPSLGADMESATLVEWKIKPGDVVKRGQVVAVVETDKGAIDVEVYESGLVEKLVAEPGTKVPVGGVLALIAGEATVPAPSPSMGEVRGEGGAEPSKEEPLTPTLSHKGRGSEGSKTRQKISPAARAHAHELNILLDSIHGTGPGGVITLQDVNAAAAKPKSSPTDTMRAVIAVAMARSKREIPHYYLSTDVDYSATTTWLAKRNAELPIEQRMLPVVPLLRAIVIALQSMPDFNGYYKDDIHHASKAIHLGVAIAQRGGGLIAPALLDAHEQSLPQLTENLRDLVNRVRAGRLKNRELSEGTITLTSLGDGGVDSVQPVIYPPQVAIIGAGTVRERAWAANGKIEARPIMTLTLAADHRVSNGRSGAQFLARIRDLLQAPEKL